MGTFPRRWLRSHKPNPIGCSFATPRRKGKLAAELKESKERSCKYRDEEGLAESLDLTVCDRREQTRRDATLRISGRRASRRHRAREREKPVLHPSPSPDEPQRGGVPPRRPDARAVAGGRAFDEIGALKSERSARVAGGTRCVFADKRKTRTRTVARRCLRTAALVFVGGHYNPGLRWVPFLGRERRCSSSPG